MDFRKVYYTFYEQRINVNNIERNTSIKPNFEVIFASHKDWYLGELNFSNQNHTFYLPSAVTRQQVQVQVQRSYNIHWSLCINLPL